jgi:hypothetical protein
MAELDLEREREIAGAGEFERADRTSSSCSGVLVPAVELRRWVIDDCVDLAKREEFPSPRKIVLQKKRRKSILGLRTDYIASLFVLIGEGYRPQSPVFRLFKVS